MGQRRAAATIARQERAGITPALGARAQTLDRISKLAYELIKVVELERSGIRDGDGSWHGSDVVGCTIRALVEAEQQNLQAWEAERDARLDCASSVPSAGMDERLLTLANAVVDLADGMGGDAQERDRAEDIADALRRIAHEQ